MLFNAQKFLLGFILSLVLLPMGAFASTEFKGTETVNINKADTATLAAYLKGIGRSKAEAIVKFRRSNGSFKSGADIKNVPGIGEATYKDIKSKISTSRGKSTAPTGYKLGKAGTTKKSTSRKSTAKKAVTKKAGANKKSTAKKSKSTKAKSSTTKAKKIATTKEKSISNKKASTKKKATAKKKTVKKKATKKTKAKKKTVKCKAGKVKKSGKCVAKK